MSGITLLLSVKSDMSDGIILLLSVKLDMSEGITLLLSVKSDKSDGITLLLSVKSDISDGIILLLSVKSDKSEGISLIEAYVLLREVCDKRPLLNIVAPSILTLSAEIFTALVPFVSTLALIAAITPDFSTLKLILSAFCWIALLIVLVWVVPSGAV